MIDQKEVRHLIHENKKIKAKIIEQARVYQEERTKLKSIQKSLQKTLEEEQQRNRNAIEEFNSQLIALESELRRAKAHEPEVTPYTKPNTRVLKPISFAQLEAESRRLSEETNRILNQSSKPETNYLYSPHNFLNVHNPSQLSQQQQQQQQQQKFQQISNNQYSQRPFQFSYQNPLPDQLKENNNYIQDIQKQKNDARANNFNRNTNENIGTDASIAKPATNNMNMNKNLNNNSNKYSNNGAMQNMNKNNDAIQSMKNNNGSMQNNAFKQTAANSTRSTNITSNPQKPAQTQNTVPANFPDDEEEEEDIISSTDEYSSDDTVPANEEPPPQIEDSEEEEEEEVEIIKKAEKSPKLANNKYPVHSSSIPVLNKPPPAPPKKQDQKQGQSPSKTAKVSTDNKKPSPVVKKPMQSESMPIFIANDDSIDLDDPFAGNSLDFEQQEDIVPSPNNEKQSSSGTEKKEQKAQPQQKKEEIKQKPPQPPLHTEITNFDNSFDDWKNSGFDLDIDIGEHLDAVQPTKPKANTTTESKNKPVNTKNTKKEEPSDDLKVPSANSFEFPSSQIQFEGISFG